MMAASWKCEGFKERRTCDKGKQFFEVFFSLWKIFNAKFFENIQKKIYI